MSQTTNTSKKSSLRKEDLMQFTGSETWYRHSLFRQFLYTDGAHYVAEQAEAYWLIDKIMACHASVSKLVGEEFCVWDLNLNDEGEGATLICTDGNENELLRETIPFTDFPLKTIRFYFQNNTLFLPSEY